MTPHRSFVLCRGKNYILAPRGHDQTAVFCSGLSIGPDLSRAWLCQDLDLAHERAALLRRTKGWSTEIRALYPES